MKTSKKIIIATITLLIVTVVVSLLLFRAPLQAVIDRGNIYQYQVPDITTFDKIDAGSNWDVKIRPERAYRIELMPEDSIYKHLIGIENGTAFLASDSSGVADGKRLKVKITVPTLSSINVGAGSTLDLGMFKLDTLAMNFGDDTKFIGIENQILDATITTTGKTIFQLTDDPDMN